MSMPAAPCPIEQRNARKAAELAARVVAAWRVSGKFTAVARRFGVTSAFVRTCVERAGAEPLALVEPPEPAAFFPALALEPVPPPEPDDEPRDLDADPIDRAEIEGWLSLRRAGWTDSDVAEEAGVAAAVVARLCSEVARAVAREEREGLEPGKVRNPRVAVLFPIGPFTPTSPCPHDGPIRRGARVYCACCDASGLDGLHPALVRDPKTDPKPERKAPPKPKAEKPLTRAERRKQLARMLRDQRDDARRTPRRPNGRYSPQDDRGRDDE